MLDWRQFLSTPCSENPLEYTLGAWKYYNYRKTLLNAIISFPNLSYKLATDDDEAVCCDCCSNKRIHVSCDPGLSSEEYKNMVDNPSDDVCLCFKCTEHVSQGAMSSQLHTDTQSLPYVCLNLGLNARIIIIKYCLKEVWFPSLYLCPSLWCCSSNWNFSAWFSAWLPYHSTWLFCV